MEFNSKFECVFPFEKHKYNIKNDSEAECQLCRNYPQKFWYICDINNLYIQLCERCFEKYQLTELDSE